MSFQLPVTATTDSYQYFSCPNGLLSIIQVYNAGVHVGFGRSLSGRSGGAVYSQADEYVAMSNYSLPQAVDEIRFKSAVAGTSANISIRVVSLDELPQVPIAPGAHPNFLTMEPDGSIGADFSGHIHAAGLDLDLGPAAGHGHDNEIAWTNVDTGVQWNSIYGYKVGTGAALGLSVTKPDAPNDYARQRFFVNPGLVGLPDSYIWLEAGNDAVAPYYKATLFDSEADSTLCPIGIILPWPGTTAPADGWYLCQGQSLAVANFPKLFAVIGYTYGGAGANFNLPDIRGRFPLGVSGGYPRASVGGAATHTLTSAEMPSHTHTQNSHAHTASSGTESSDHYHTFGGYNVWVNGGPFGVAGGSTYSINLLGNTNWRSHAHTHAITVDGNTATNQNTGGGGSHNNMPPYLALNYIIRTGRV